MQQSRHPGSRSDAVATLAMALLLAAAFVFGGGPRGAGDLVVHVIALPCLALGVLRWRMAAATRWQRWFLAWWLVALAVVGLQLLPLPPDMFAALGARAGLAADLQAAGAIDAWRPMTLDSWGTVRALLALLTFGAAWLLSATLSMAMRRRLLQLALALGAAMALLGLAQAAAGTHAPFRFHVFHHPVGAIGTFANRNHFADLMAMLIPPALAFAAQAQASRRLPAAGAWFGLAVLLWLAAALSFSRTGFALATLAVLATLAFLYMGRGAGRRWLVPVLVLVAGLLVIGHYALDGLAQRLAQDPLEDLRWQYLRNGIDVMQAWWPWGSGAGSFPWVYAPMEPVAQMGASFADRAHNDLLQVLVEAGLPGLALIVTFLSLAVWWAAGIFPMGRARAGDDHWRAGVVVVSLAVPLVHSLVDYPLRTCAITALAALLLSLHRVQARQ